MAFPLASNCSIERLNQSIVSRNPHSPPSLPAVACFPLAACRCLGPRNTVDNDSIYIRSCRYLWLASKKPANLSKIGFCEESPCVTRKDGNVDGRVPCFGCRDDGRRISQGPVARPWFPLAYFSKTYHRLLNPNSTATDKVPTSMTGNGKLYHFVESPIPLRFIFCLDPTLC